MSTFVDDVTIDVAAGRGGRGSRSFRREKYVPHGGPDGGDGGHGGSVVIVATSGDTTLSAFRDKRRYAAQNGGDGSGQKRSGRGGEDCVIEVPPGTLIHDGDDVVADLDRAGMSLVVAKGGRGGRGNVHFASATHQAPRHAELGDPGEARQLRLELKLVADIGLVGLPNAGKSTFLAAVTGARPKIAAYPFTTLHPNLGVADIDEVHGVVIADVPGIIEGAHRGVGLGLEFLRHLERTRVLVHVVDASQGEDVARKAIADVRGELASFSTVLAERPALLVFNKIDVPGVSVIAQTLAAEFSPSMAISAMLGEGCREALHLAAELVVTQRKLSAPQTLAEPTHRVYRHEVARDEAPVVVRENDGFRVFARGVERLVGRTDMNNDESVGRMTRVLRRAGIDNALRAAGCTEGDTVHIGNIAFDFVDEESNAHR